MAARINSIYQLAAYGAMPIGAISGGILARTLNLNAPFLAAGSILLLTAAALARQLTPSERQD